MGIPVPNERLEHPLPHLQDYLNGNHLPTRVPIDGNPDLARFPKHSREIKFTEHGLVDPSVLLEYMSGPQCQHLECPRDHSSCKLEYHHLYFSAKQYKKSDQVYSWLRNSRYNQILIHSCQEDLYHQTHQEEVALPDKAAAERFFEEKAWLDDLALVSGGLALTKNKIERIHGESRQRVARTLARLALYEEMVVSAQDKINDIELIHPTVVTGALVGYLNQIPEDNLSGLVSNRLEDDSSFLIPRIHTYEHIQNQSEDEFDKRVKKMGWTLQLLVKEPQSAAA